MKSSLKTIQIFARVAKIISLIIFVGGIIAAVGAVGGIIGLALGWQIDWIKVEGLSLSNFIIQEANLSVNQMYLALTAGALVCGAGIALSWLTYLYCKHEIAVGTPFTMAGAREIRRLGIITIAVDAGTALVVALVISIMSALLHTTLPLSYNNGSEILIGVIYLALSYVFQYGAETFGLTQPSQPIPTTAENVLPDQDAPVIEISEPQK